ncbi:hypothetical protein [Methanimicrococcus blatticola]|uniref:Uncharacterized protein n=1 Tax=Methanimicrococcus blatticola TaxID=91560 RepID=A0A484F446_9EURY|nr:hypothetical protein [Methanimicrococcus blatticola]MBZ3936012.1 hypothetical protein [Methanimicrococcus blatticola]MCC2509375.1 hypothetical protein [Methanimicrococcus blatticola]TDQ68258.1 hypothetical protein C7391_1197 [Methanimicrococcus blatticola]
MITQKKQLFLIFIILFAAIGIVGAGCLKSGDSAANDTVNNTTNNTTNDTTNNNTNNNTNSNNNTNNNTTNNTTNNTPPTSGLPDVVYATQGNGGGGKSNSAPSSPATLNGKEVVVDQSPAVDGVVKWYFYIPSTEIIDETIVLTMPGVITDFNVETTSLIAPIGTTETNSSYDGKVANIYFSGDTTTPWNTPDLTISVGDVEYKISFYATAAWEASATAGGSFEFVELANPADAGRVFNIARISAGATKYFVSEERVIEFTLTPNNGYTGFLEVTDSNGDPVDLTKKDSNTYETSAVVTSQTYTVNAIFEKKAVATDEDGNKLVVDQNLVANRNIFIYVPSGEIEDEDISVDIGKSVSGAVVINSYAVASATPSGNIVTITMASPISGLENGGIPAPSTVTVEATASDGTVYNIFVLKSAVLKITVPSGVTLISDGGLDLTSGTYYFVTDINSKDLFTASAGTVYIDGTPATSDYTFSESKTYVLTIEPTT